MLQGVGFAFRDCFNALAASGTELDSAFVIGGGSRSDYWVQQMASILEIPLHKTVDGDFGASLGAARLGMIAAEQCDPLSVCTTPTIESTVEPDTSISEQLAHHYERFQAGYKSLQPLFASRDPKK